MCVCVLVVVGGVDRRREQNIRETGRNLYSVIMMAAQRGIASLWEEEEFRFVCDGH